LKFIQLFSSNQRIVSKYGLFVWWLFGDSAALGKDQFDLADFGCSHQQTETKVCVLQQTKGQTDDSTKRIEIDSCSKILANHARATKTQQAGEKTLGANRIGTGTASGNHVRSRQVSIYYRC
jgi:hypothetical protein